MSANIRKRVMTLEQHHALAGERHVQVLTANGLDGDVGQLGLLFQGSTFIRNLSRVELAAFQRAGSMPECR